MTHQWDPSGGYLSPGNATPECTLSAVPLEAGMLLHKVTTLQDTHPPQVIKVPLGGSETCPSVREAGLQAVDFEGKNPEAFDSPWGNDDRKS